jgi:hypothetical protein
MWSVAINQTSGIFFISIIPEDLLGPTAVYIVAKQVPGLNTANILRINSSPVDDTFISLRWNSNSFIEINKSSNLFDKNYTIVNNFQKDYLNTSVVLSQTEFTFIPKSFFKFYEKKSFFISISHSTNPEGPACIASVSKNKYNTNGNVFYCGSNNIEIKWNSQELLKIRKTTLDYDGVYSLKFTKIIP